MELIIDDVSKRFREDVWGLRDVSLSVGPGVIGLLGPNGAGKSTLMRILATITQPSSGRVTWNGSDIARQPDVIRRVLGYLPQDFGVYPNLTAIEFLRFLAAAKGLDGRSARARIDQLVELVNLSDAANRPIGGFSGGMRQRVGIAQALLNDPQLLIVDEPTVGLDPTERLRFRNLLSDLAGERIVMLSTHIVSDVEATATSIALIKGGRLLRHALPEDLLRDVAGKVWTWIVPSTELATTKARFDVSATVRRAEGVLVRVVCEGTPDPSAEPAVATLEDAYHHAVGAGALLEA
ncbi:MAG: ABC transporter ATP-binding protein [Trueperaceae bacterium]|nr:MAG: ABC transporter ATP-binding protein [Trueperaceae bacterium]